MGQNKMSNFFGKREVAQHTSSMQTYLLKQPLSQIKIFKFSSEKCKHLKLLKLSRKKCCKYIFYLHKSLKWNRLVQHTKTMQCMEDKSIVYK